jgi:hypothetical protein
MSRAKHLMDTIWELDDGITFKFYDTTHAKTLRQAGIGTKVIPSIFAKESLGRKELKEATITGRARDELQVRVTLKGNKTPETYWAGFWDIKKG